MRGMGPYEFTQQISADGRPWGFGVRGSYTYDEQGRVFKSGRKSPVGIWYALIGQNNTTRQYVVRRDKLNDVQRIEAFRWKVYLHHLKIWRRYQDAHAMGKKLGRVWNEGAKGFHVWDDHGSCAPERAPRRHGAVDKLARIPVPEEIEAGREFFAADDALHESYGRRSFADLLLSRAFTIANPDSEPQHVQPRTAARTVRHVVNGRKYIQHTPAGWAQGTTKLWPEPTDEVKVYDHSWPWRNCTSCGVLFMQNPPQTRCKVCQPLRRGTPAPVRTLGADLR